MKKNRKKKPYSNKTVHQATVNKPPVVGEDYAFAANMKALEENYPQIAELIKNTAEEEYQFVRTGEGRLPNLLDRKDNTYYYNPQNPWQDVENQILSLNLKNARLAIFLGLGLGYELVYFYKNMMENQLTHYILVVQKNLEVFKAALRSFNFEALIRNSRVHFLVAQPEESLYTILRNYLAEDHKFVLIKAAKPLYHPSAFRYDKEYYLRFLQILRDAAKHQTTHFGNDPYDSLIGIENMLSNLREIVYNPGIKLLYDKFRNKPAIVVATGPSLNKNKHLLKGLENKALLIAADASLRVMIEMGVKPHLVTSLERNLPTVRLLEGFTGEQLENVFLAACPVVRNECYQVYPGPRIMVYRDYDHFRWLNIDKGILKIQLSAGNMAFKLAEALGCNPIILIGQDLSFARDGRTHADGTPFGEKQNPDKFRKLEVMGNDGLPILTHEVWYSFIKSYELDLSNYKGICINSTEGGAYIQGTEIMTFKEAIEQYIQDDFYPSDIILNCLKSFNDLESERDLEKVLELVNKTILEMNEIINECRKGVELHNKYKEEFQAYLNSSRDIPGTEYLSKLEEVIMRPKKDCMKSYQTFQLFFAHVIQSFSIKFEMDMNQIPEKYDDSRLSKIEVLARQVEWYSVIGDIAVICKKSLINAKDSIEKDKYSLHGAHYENCGN